MLYNTGFASRGVIKTLCLASSSGQADSERFKNTT